MYDEALLCAFGGEDLFYSKSNFTKRKDDCPPKKGTPLPSVQIDVNGAYICILRGIF